MCCGMGYTICPHFKEMLQKFHECCGHFKLYLPLCPFSSNSLPLEVFYLFFKNMYFLAMLHGMWDLGCPNRIEPACPAVKSYTIFIYKYISTLFLYNRWQLASHLVLKIKLQEMQLFKSINFYSILMVINVEGSHHFSAVCDLIYCIYLTCFLTVLRIGL